VDAQRPGQVGHHHHRTVEDAYEEEILASVVRIDEAGDLDESLIELALGVEDLGQVVGDIAQIHGETLAQPVPETCRWSRQSLTGWQAGPARV
jgi:hypothetical protein